MHLRKKINTNVKADCHFLLLGHWLIGYFLIFIFFNFFLIVFHFVMVFHLHLAGCPEVASGSPHTVSIVPLSPGPAPGRAGLSVAMGTVCSCFAVGTKPVNP